MLLIAGIYPTWILFCEILFLGLASCWAALEYLNAQLCGLCLVYFDDSGRLAGIAQTDFIWRNERDSWMYCEKSLLVF